MPAGRAQARVMAQVAAEGAAALTEFQSGAQADAHGQALERAQTHAQGDLADEAAQRKLQAQALATAEALIPSITAVLVEGATQMQVAAQLHGAAEALWNRMRRSDVEEDHGLEEVGRKPHGASHRNSVSHLLAIQPATNPGVTHEPDTTAPDKCVPNLIQPHGVHSFHGLREDSRQMQPARAAASFAPNHRTQSRASSDAKRRSGHVHDVADVSAGRGGQEDLRRGPEMHRGRSEMQKPLSHQKSAITGGRRTWSGAEDDLLLRLRADKRTWKAVGAAWEEAVENGTIKIGTRSWQTLRARHSIVRKRRYEDAPVKTLSTRKPARTRHVKSRAGVWELEEKEYLAKLVDAGGSVCGDRSTVDVACVALAEALNKNGLGPPRTFGSVKVQVYLLAKSLNVSVPQLLSLPSASDKAMNDVEHCARDDEGISRMKYENDDVKDADIAESDVDDDDIVELKSDETMDADWC